MKLVKCLIVLLSIFMFVPNVYARQLCTKTVYDELKEKVNDVKITTTKEEKDGKKYTLIEASNVDENLMIYHNGNIYEPEDGMITFKIDSASDDYDLKFYGGYDHPCVEEYVATKRIFNKYSEKDECDGNEEWELCKEEYDGYIKNDEEFKEKLDEYLNSDEKKEIESEKKSSKTRKVILIGGAIVIIVGGVYIYKNSNKKKTVKKGKSE